MRAFQNSKKYSEETSELTVMLPLVSPHKFDCAAKAGVLASASYQV